MKLTETIKRKARKAIKKTLPKEMVLQIQRKRHDGLFLKQGKPNSYRLKHTYAVVSAVYNVNKYLDDYFECFVNQTAALDNLKLILVDDGSTDSSADTIIKWQMKYPDLIEYHRKENGGQASARNMGMQFVKAEWVTFIDSDDFVSLQYFEEIDKAIESHPSLKFISCNWIYFFEDRKEFSDTHYLRYRFKETESYFSVDDDYMPVQYGMNSAFFLTEEIRRQNLSISEKIRPNFEDGHFCNKYLLDLKTGIVGLLKKPKYYYRKRADGTSTLDKAWKGFDRLLKVPEYGYLDLLKWTKENRGYIPAYVQNTVLCDLKWYFSHFIGHEERSKKAVDAGAADQFWNNLIDIFDYIDIETIKKCRNDWFSFTKKEALLKLFKDTEQEHLAASVKNIDFEQNLILIQSISPEITISYDGQAVTPVEVKRQQRLVMGRPFYDVFYIWFPFKRDSQVISYSTKDHKKTYLAVRGKKFANTIGAKALVKRWTRDWAKYKQNSKEIWIFMDCVTRADDNGEHLYRWVVKNHPEQECYFVLSKSSADWPRLKAEGFNLLDFGSSDHERILKESSIIISSHADDYACSYFKDKFFKSKQYVFLQHGVIGDDASSWVNQKPIDLMLTSAPAEYHSIVDDGTQYGLTPRQVSLSGLPRHDALLTKECKGKEAIVVMPTWRSSLAPIKALDSDELLLSEDFETSQFKDKWESFLSSESLRNIAEKSEMRIVFYPHPNILPYVEAGLFHVPDYIEIGNDQAAASIQQTFADAAVLVTDYSSAAFENAYLEKPVIYYQFDKKEFFSGAHLNSLGYFDYEDDGFGPVAIKEDKVISALQELADNSFQPADTYAKRMRDFFAFRDGKCCERAYTAINALREPAIF